MSTREPTITEFLLARIAEDEVTAQESIDHPDADGFDSPHQARWWPPRVLAECEAKRRIVDLHIGEVIEMEGVIVLSICEVCHNSEMHTAAHWPCATIKALASVYDDHPDFREEWRS